MRPEYAAGVRNAVRTCLGIEARDRVAVIRDRDRGEIAAAIEEEIEATGARRESWLLEALGERPLLALPSAFGDEIAAFRPSASLFVAGGRPGEIAFRKPLLELLTGVLGSRHGHMIGIDHRLMLDGMAADYEEVHRVTRLIYEIVRSAGRIEVGTRKGTDLFATFSPRHRWVPCDGRYHERGQWGNLPEGEVFTAPLSVDGLLVGEEMGDYFAERDGVLDPPVRIRIQAGRVTSVELPGRPEVLSEFEAYLGQHPESNRAGEFAIGTNVTLRRIVGNFLQDEKFPGVHVAFGDPYGHHTGADWSCPSHVDVLASQATVAVDGRRIMEDGRFLI
ncbi:MAG: aminopeptidase [Candidatus Dormibacteraceae bacterium]